MLLALCPLLSRVPAAGPRSASSRGSLLCCLAAGLLREAPCTRPAWVALPKGQGAVGSGAGQLVYRLAFGLIVSRDGSIKAVSPFEVEGVNNSIFST